MGAVRRAVSRSASRDLAHRGVFDIVGRATTLALGARPDRHPQGVWRGASPGDRRGRGRDLHGSGRTWILSARHRPGIASRQTSMNHRRVVLFASVDTPRRSFRARRPRRMGLPRRSRCIAFGPPSWSCPGFVDGAASHGLGGRTRTIALLELLGTEVPEAAVASDPCCRRPRCTRRPRPSPRLGSPSPSGR